jgi:hypothetical protein
LFAHDSLHQLIRPVPEKGIKKTPSGKKEEATGFILSSRITLPELAPCLLTYAADH